MFFSTHNRNRAGFVPDGVAVVKSALICGCGLEFLKVVKRLRLSDPSLVVSQSRIYAPGYGDLTLVVRSLRR